MDYIVELCMTLSVVTSYINAVAIPLTHVLSSFAVNIYSTAGEAISLAEKLVEAWMSSTALG